MAPIAAPPLHVPPPQWGSYRWTAATPGERPAALQPGPDARPNPNFPAPIKGPGPEAIAALTPPPLPTPVADPAARLLEEARLRRTLAEIIRADALRHGLVLRER